MNEHEKLELWATLTRKYTDKTDIMRICVTDDVDYSSIDISESTDKIWHDVIKIYSYSELLGLLIRRVTQNSEDNHEIFTPEQIIILQEARQVLLSQLPMLNNPMAQAVFYLYADGSGGIGKTFLSAFAEDITTQYVDISLKGEFKDV